MMGKERGKAIKKYLVMPFAPSKSAASNKPSGKPLKNVLNKSIPIGTAAAIDGKITPSRVFTSPNSFTILNCGIIVKILGIIIIDNTIINKKFLPGNSYLVNPYAIAEQTNKMPTVVMIAMINVFKI